MSRARSQGTFRGTQVTFDKVKARFEGLGGRFEGVKARFEGVKARLTFRGRHVSRDSGDVSRELAFLEGGSRGHVS